MRILHLLSQRPDSTGSGIYLQAMLREAARKGHTNGLIAVVANDESISLPSCHASSFIRIPNAKMRFAIPGMSDVMPYTSSRFNDLSNRQIEIYENFFVKKIAEMIEQFRPDIIHSHHLWLLSSLAKQRFPSIPQVTSCHGSDLRQFHLCQHLRQRVIKGCRQIEKILALCHTQKQEIQDTYNIPEHKIDVVGAGYDDKHFQYGEKSSSGPLQLLYCGKLSRAKGVPWLLRALAKVAGESWHLHLVGSGTGDEQQECLQLTEKFGDRITIHGSVGQEKLAKLLKTSHIFILPSLYEGLPLVILEALACSCRIVSTNLPGCLKIKKNVTSGLITLVPLPRLHTIDQPYPEDEEKFINDIRKAVELCLHSCRAVPSLAPKIVEENALQFNWQNVFARIEQIYHQLYTSSR